MTPYTPPASALAYRLSKSIWLGSILEYRAPDLLDHFRKTGEICRASWFPMLDDDDVRKAFEIAEHVVQRRDERRVMDNKNAQNLGQQVAKAHSFTSEPHHFF